MSDARRAIGLAGEDVAAAYLRGIGYAIVRRNLRGPGGEIDVVARDGTTIVFVEVKARRTRTYGSAVSAVDARKRGRIRAVAADWLQFFAPEAIARFDVLAIDGERVRHVRDAFR